MNRFSLTTIVAILASLGGAVLLHDSAREWCLLALAAIYVAIFAAGMTCISLQFFCAAMCGGNPALKQVALTFDDGPDPNATPALLDWLRREKIHATFFCIGRKVEEHPELARRIVTEGHLLGNHFYTHAWWTPMLMSRGLAGEMQRTQDAIKRATGFVPTLVRPPAGLTNPHYPAALRRVGLRMVGWNLRTFDTSRSAKSVILRIRRRLRPGSIIVLHDGNAQPAMLAEILEETVQLIRSRGLDLVRIDELGDGDLNATGRKHK